MSSVSGTRGAVFQLAGSGSLVFGVAAGAAMGVGRSGLAEPLGGCDLCGAELAADELALDELAVEAPIGWREIEPSLPSEEQALLVLDPQRHTITRVKQRLLGDESRRALGAMTKLARA